MAAKQLGKKGMFLTFISIAIIAAATIIFTPSDINLRKDISITKTRVSSVNDFILDLEKVYLERTLHLSGIKTINALISYMEQQSIITSSVVFLPHDFETDFSEVLLDGTITIDPNPPEPIDNFYPGSIMVGNTYTDWLDKIKTAAKTTYNIDETDITLSVTDIRVTQTSPWFVGVEADISFFISSESASWDKDMTITTIISVENFNDPYYSAKYSAKTGAPYENRMIKSSTLPGEWNVEEVKAFIRHGNYTHFTNTNAPTFIMRFIDESQWSDASFDEQKECCGIESIVNPDEILPASQRDKALSYVDYKFFPYWDPGPNCEDTTLYTETDIENEFRDIKFDSSDLDSYKISYDPLADVQPVCPP